MNKNHKTSVEYENEVIFHIPDYSKPIQFESVEFLQEDLTSHIPV
jgi:hypothetical protein